MIEIGNHCGVMVAWSHKTLNILKKFFWKRSLTVKFSKFCFDSFHRDIDRPTTCSNFVKFGRWEIGEIVRCLPDKKNLPGSSAVATAWIAPKICQGQPPTMYSECSRFHPNRFIFGGVIAECVNTTKMHCKINPIFGWSLALSRINKQPKNTNYIGKLVKYW